MQQHEVTVTIRHCLQHLIFQTIVVPVAVELPVTAIILVVDRVAQVAAYRIHQIDCHGMVMIIDEEDIIT